jgi:hypothetical protein
MTKQPCFIDPLIRETRHASELQKTAAAPADRAGEIATAFYSVQQQNSGDC